MTEVRCVQHCLLVAVVLLLAAAAAAAGGWMLFWLLPPLRQLLLLLLQPGRELMPLQLLRLQQCTGERPESTVL